MQVLYKLCSSSIRGLFNFYYVAIIVPFKFYSSSNNLYSSSIHVLFKFLSGSIQVVFISLQVQFKFYSRYFLVLITLYSLGQFELYSSPIPDIFKSYSCYIQVLAHMLKLYKQENHIHLVENT